MFVQKYINVFVSAKCFLRDSRQLRRFFVAAALIFTGLISQPVLAQSSACNANEDTITFDFGPNLTSSTGSTRTWTAGSLANVYNVATGVGQNTISFTAAGAVFTAGEPQLINPVGNVANSLQLRIDATASLQRVSLTLVFNRPMDKVRFRMLDLDTSATFQDVLQVSGFMNGTATIIPALTAVIPGNYTTTTVGVSNQITTNLGIGNCGFTDPNCNITVDFINPVDRVVISFIAGAAIPGDPTPQLVAFNDFSYCVPKRDLRVTKTSGTNTFVAGATTTYLLTINNRGGVATTGITSVTDVISAQGVAFVTPQTPTPWTCAFGTTTFVADTANCFSATAIAAGGTTVLTLTVSISPATTASTAINRAKVYGGGDPNKTLVTSTGPIANCDALNENFSGGGATYFGGVDTTDAGCSFESTPIVRRALLTVAKDNGSLTLTAGVTTTYTITFANLGPSNAPGTMVFDNPSSGLSCTTPTFISTPLTSVTTSPITLSTTSFQVTGISLTPTFPANSTATFVVACGVRATGLP